MRPSPTPKTLSMNVCPAAAVNECECELPSQAELSRPRTESSSAERLTSYVPSVAQSGFEPVTVMQSLEALALRNAKRSKWAYCGKLKTLGGWAHVVGALMSAGMN